jgi:endoglucanase
VLAGASILIALWLARAPGIDEAAGPSRAQLSSITALSTVTVYGAVRAHALLATRSADLYRARLQAEAARAAAAALHADLRLHGVGAQLSTAWNAPVTLKAMNWYGFEYAPFVPNGLDRVPLDSILATLRTLGLNAIRLTFADETVESNPVVTSGVDANPGFRGMHALDVMKTIIEHAQRFDLRVILANSRSEAGRGPELISGMWFTNEYPQSAWVADWETLIRRFRGLSAFVGADLRNEPHVVGGALDQNAYFNNGPLWGAYQGTYYHDRDWHYASQTLGNDLLQIDPRVLIVVEGVQMYLDPDKNVLTGALWGSNLIGVQYDPIELSRPSQLVYSVHEYGPHMWQADWFNPKTTYASLAARWDQLWGYLLSASSYLRAPIFVGEFGTCHDYYSCIASQQPWKQGFWFQSFVHYLHDHPEVGWAYWALNPSGPFHPQDVNFYSLVSSDWQHYYPLLVHNLAPLLQEPDGIWGGRQAWPPATALTPQPGCFAYRSCLSSVEQAQAVVPTGQTAPEQATSVRVTYTIPYVHPADPYRLGDLYLPQAPARAPQAPAHPAVILVHGRTWAHGRKGTPAMTVLAGGLAWHGYVTYDIAYRLTQEGGGYPRDIQDVKDAVGFLTANARRLDIDPSKIAVVGADTGGYLALMAAYTPDKPPFSAPHYPNLQVHLAAVGSFYSPINLSGVAKNSNDQTLLVDLQSYLGATYQDQPQRYWSASPIAYVDTGVPTIFFQGIADGAVPFAQTFRAYKYLKQRTIQSELVDLPGAPHGMGALHGVARRSAVAQLTRFLDEVFYTRPWQGGR